MWIRKSPTEVSLEKRTRLLRATILDVLFGVSLWYGLVQLSIFLGLLSRNSLSGYIGCAVIAVVLPAAWYSNKRARHGRAGTMVCDRCNALKTSDDQPNCNCGGQYLILPEMKWINAAPSGRIFPIRAESHLLTRNTPLKSVGQST
jgi:hypothetical protein